MDKIWDWIEDHWWYVLLIIIPAIIYLIIWAPTIFSGKDIIPGEPERVELVYGYEYCPKCDGFKYTDIELATKKAPRAKFQITEETKYTGKKCRFCDGEGMVPVYNVRITY